MRQSACTLIAWVLCCVPAWAGQVTLTLPDVQLASAIADVCWYQRPACDMDWTDQQKASWVADWAVTTISLGHYHGLGSVSGTVTVTYDQETP